MSTKNNFFPRRAQSFMFNTNVTTHLQLRQHVQYACSCSEVFNNPSFAVSINSKIFSCFEFTISSYQFQHLDWRNDLTEPVAKLIFQDSTCSLPSTNAKSLLLQSPERTEHSWTVVPYELFFIRVNRPSAPSRICFFQLKSHTTTKERNVWNSWSKSQFHFLNHNYQA